MRGLNRFIAESIREIVFGLEDALVSTLGALTGIAVGTGSTFIVILSGLVLLAAEGMSMAAGSYLSSKSAYEVEKQLHSSDGQKLGHASNPVRAALVMGVSYFVGGMFPLAPYFFLPIRLALIVSISVTVVVLFVVGAWSSLFTKRSAARSGFEMVIISLIAAIIGYAIARGVSWYFGVVV